MQTVTIIIKYIPKQGHGSEAALLVLYPSAKRNVSHDSLLSSCFIRPSVSHCASAPVRPCVTMALTPLPGPRLPFRVTHPTWVTAWPTGHILCSPCATPLNH